LQDRDYLEFQLNYDLIKFGRDELGKAYDIEKETEILAMTYNYTALGFHYTCEAVKKDAPYLQVIPLPEGMIRIRASLPRALGMSEVDRSGNTSVVMGYMPMSVLDALVSAVPRKKGRRHIQFYELETRPEPTLCKSFTLLSLVSTRLKRQLAQTRVVHGSSRGTQSE